MKEQNLRLKVILHPATFEVARGIARADPRVRVIRLRRNFGQTAAMAAGFDHARGRILATLDGDLQNDPSDLPVLLDRIEEGADVVCGRRSRREDPLWTKYGEQARKQGGHGGMDFIMNFRLMQILRHGLPPDSDVYDAAEWSAPGPLSEQSASRRSAAVDFPDLRHR